MLKKLTLAPLLLLLLTSCVVARVPRSLQTSPAAQVVPNVPLQKWGVESCGAGALSSVLQHHGDPTTMEEWDAVLPKMRGGVLSVDLMLAAREKGYDAQIVTGNRETIEKELSEGRPLILMLQMVQSLGRSYDFFHYIVVDGIDRERGLIRTQFGDARGRWVRLERLEKTWAGGGHAALLIRPADVNTAIRAAVALEEDGKLAEAAARYRQLLERHPDSVLAWTNLGNVEARRGESAAAEEAYRRALALDGRSRDTLNNLAWFLLQQKKLEEAESFARQAAGVEGPDGYLVLDTLARVLAARGSCAESRDVFGKAIASVPETRVTERAEIEKARDAACPGST